MNSAPPTDCARRWSGVHASLPIVVGYLPVAFAFGFAGVASGLNPWEVTLMSALIFAGASQFVVLGAVKAGTPWLWIVALCALMNVRHLLYGPLLVRMMPAALRTRLLFAFALSDEVFATALSKLATVEEPHRGSWLIGLGFGAYAAWVAGTAVGACLGEGLEQLSTVLSHTMMFSLPALFLALSYQCLKRAVALPMLVSAVVSGALALAGHASLAILAGALLGTLCFRNGS